MAFMRGSTVTRDSVWWPGILVLQLEVLSLIASSHLPMHKPVMLEEEGN